MAKKKAKTFPLKELVSIYENGNYQKVISKTKQFAVDGISKNDLDVMICNSYEKLSYQNFQSGDIQRALRDIDTLLTIKDNEKYRLLKLKYLLYIEYFAEAVQYAVPLLTSKIDAIKKEAVFLYLLAKIYNKEYGLEAEYLKILPVSRKNYVLGFLEFCKGNTAKAIEYLDKSNPKLKQEKVSITALKFIILKHDIDIKVDTKPLYNFLLWGDDKNLQNTKNSRVVKSEVLQQFGEKNKNRGVENLLSLQSPTTPEIILEGVQDKEKQVKLIYNNIVLLIEKKRNSGEALEQFIKYQDKLVGLIESVTLLYSIFRMHEDEEYRVEQKLLPFFKKYLELHHNKLFDFQLQYLFHFMLHAVSNPTKKLNTAYVELAKSYEMEHLVFITQTLFSMKELNFDFHTKSLEKLLGNPSGFINNIVKESFHMLAVTDSMVLNQDARTLNEYQTKLHLIIEAFARVENPHKKNKKLLLHISQILANLLQTFKMSAQNKAIYAKLIGIIEHHIESYNITPTELPRDIKALFVAFSTKKDIKVLIPLDHEDMYERLFFNMFHSHEQESTYNFDESEYDFIIYKKNFIEYLDAGKNPLEALKGFTLRSGNYHKQFINIFYLLSIVNKKEKLTQKFLNDFFVLMNIDVITQPREREMFPQVIKEFAPIDLDTTLFVTQQILSQIKGINTVWALNLIYAYLELFSKYPLKKDKEFDRYLELFYAIYSKGKFVSMKIKYNAIKKMFGEAGSRKK